VTRSDFYRDEGGEGKVRAFGAVRGFERMIAFLSEKRRCGGRGVGMRSLWEGEEIQGNCGISEHDRVQKGKI